MGSETLGDRIARHEGTGPMKRGRYFPYKCTAGKLTIGIGRNLDDRGLSHDEVALMLQNDIRECKDGVFGTLPWVANLSQLRQEVLIEMAFQMGVAGLLTFKNTLAAIEKGDYARSGQMMRMSLWYKQTPKRAEELIKIMETNSTEGR